MMAMTLLNTPPPPPPPIPLPDLPHHLVLNNILPRLPVKSLIRFSCVCKLWYESLGYGNPHFHSTYFLQSQENPVLMFHFFNGYSSSFSANQYFFYLNKDDAVMKNNIISKQKNENGAGGGVKLRRLITLPNRCRAASVGNCNGLVCHSMVYGKRRLIQIFNPSRHESLYTRPPIELTQSMRGYGFGFDSLTKEYKVVCIFDRLEYSCVVYTLGSNSWRKIRGPPRLPVDHGKSAVHCNGNLYWRSYKPYWLLSFDLHDETFQLIQVPIGWRINCWINDCNWCEEIWVDCIQFKGYLCFARLEKFGPKHCKVHLHILVNKIKQRWVQESNLVSFPCQDNTRIMGFSDQVLLYWFYGECFQFYNLHTEVSKVVRFPGGRYSEKKYRYDLRDSTSSDYQVYSHVPNFFSLRTFVPKDAPKIYYDPIKYYNDRGEEPPRACVFLYFLHKELYF